MPSLKEVKTRIASVNSTRKITSAMKMVASSKLHRAQQAIENMRPYEMQLDHIMQSFVANIDGDIESPYTRTQEARRVALVLLTSNSSLCGGFNANAIKALRKHVDHCRQEGIEVTKVITLGRKGHEAARKLGIAIEDYSHLNDSPNYLAATQIMAQLMDDYAHERIDKVEVIYHHFKSAATQVLTQDTLLPISLPQEQATEQGTLQNNYIIEPGPAQVVSALLPKVLHLKLYTALLDSLASEHAARVIAMQIATDNADELLQELTLTYNKTRQQAITTELLDIVGGSMH